MDAANKGEPATSRQWSEQKGDGRTEPDPTKRSNEYRKAKVDGIQPMDLCKKFPDFL